MRLLLKIFIFLLLLTSPLSVNSSEPEVLYLWQISSGHEWESYGNENIQQKYEGITSNGEPDGKGILSFPDGKRVTGEWCLVAIVTRLPAHHSPAHYSPVGVSRSKKAKTARGTIELTLYL